MTRLAWGAAGKRIYETGLDHGVLYLRNGTAVVWNGLTGVDESLSGDTDTPVYFDGVLVSHTQSKSDFAASLTAYTYPAEFEDLEGVDNAGGGLMIDNQTPQQFNLSFRTRVHSDQSEDIGYKIHVLYNLTAVPAGDDIQSNADDAEIIEFSWQLDGVPDTITNYIPTAHAIIDTRYIRAELLAELEDILYGSATSSARLPPMPELLTFVTEWAFIRVVDLGDGTFNITAPDYLITQVDTNTFEIAQANNTAIDSESYSLSNTD